MTETLTLLSGSENTIMPTGYAIVMKNLLPRLNELGWDCYHMGWQHQGMPQPYSDSKGRTYTELHAGLLPYAHPEFPENGPMYIKQYKPDVLFSLIDFWYTFGMSKHARDNNLPYVCYFPVDGEPFNLNWLDELKRCHTPLGMSYYGKQVIMDTVEKYAIGGWKRHFKMDVLYHGIDHTIFHPFTDQKKVDLKAELFKAITNPPDYFIVGVVGKNMQRKQHTKAIEAFAKFAKDKKDVLLLFKVGDPENRSGLGSDMYELIVRLGIDKKVTFLDEANNIVQGISTERMSALYNIMDVYLSATSGEGFGIPTLEAMACGTPSIITDYTTSKELIKDSGWLIPIKDTWMGQWNIKRGMVDTDLMAMALQEAYDDRKKVRKLGQKAHRYSLEFGWDKIAKQLDRILKSSING